MSSSDPNFSPSSSASSASISGSSGPFPSASAPVSRSVSRSASVSGSPGPAPSVRSGSGLSDPSVPSLSGGAASGARTVRADPLAVFRRIVPRDHALLALLAEHYLLSTPQIAAAFFDNRRTAQRRLTTLHRLDVVHRFAYPNPENTAVPYLYTLGQVGLQLYPDAYHDPDDRHTKTPRSSLERARRIAASASAAHLLGVNQFFIDLLTAARYGQALGAPDSRLLRWWSEQHATDVYAQSNIRPDGHGIWSAEGRTVGFFLEHDRGTEFSGGRGPCRSPDLRVSAAQRLMKRRYRPRQVWCKHACGVSPVRVVDAGRPSIHAGQCGGLGRAGDGSSVPAAGAWPCDAGVLSRVLGGRASESAAFRAWCPCRGSGRGWSDRRSRDRHPNRPARQPWATAQGRFADRAVLLRKTFRGLSCGGGIHA